MLGWFRRFCLPPPPLVLFRCSSAFAFLFPCLFRVCPFQARCVVLVFSLSLFSCVPLFASWLSKFHFIVIVISLSFSLHLPRCGGACVCVCFTTPTTLCMDLKASTTWMYFHGPWLDRFRRPLSKPMGLIPTTKLRRATGENTKLSCKRPATGSC